MAGPRSPRRRDDDDDDQPCSWSCCLCATIVLVTLFGLAAIFLWLSIRGATAATAVAATLARFDLVDGGPSSGASLQYNLTVDIRLRNTKRDGTMYDRAEAQASYGAERLGYGPVEPFYLDGKNERIVTAAFNGSSPVDDANTVRTYRRERSEGFYFVKVLLYYRMKLTGRYTTQRYKNKISCTLRLPVPNMSATPVTTLLETTCHADY